MEIFAGYTGAFAIGLILGLMGGGGSILTVPLLVYVLGLDPVIATAYSLFTVGITSSFGAIQNTLKQNVSFGTGITVVLPSFIAVYLTRRHIVPFLPDTIIHTKALTVSRDTFIMLLFAAVMLLASLSMLMRKPAKDNARPEKMNYAYMFPAIAVIGIFMGLVGAGGGFLIIPMLVFFGGLPIKKAVGTSLLVIALNSLTGFAGDMQTLNIQWDFLLPFTMLSVFGIFAGTFLHRFINESQLRRGFGWFILIMAAFILAKEAAGF